MLQCRTTNSKCCEDGTEESQIETSIELSETVNLFIKQNTYFLSNSPSDLILIKLHEHLTYCTVIFWYTQ